MLSDLGRDVRYAIRSLLRTPTFTVTVIVTLSLGIGANAVIFSAVDAVLLRDAPVSDPDSLVNVSRHPVTTPTRVRPIQTISTCGTVARSRRWRPTRPCQSPWTRTARLNHSPGNSSPATTSRLSGSTPPSAVAWRPTTIGSGRPFVSRSSRMRSGCGCSTPTDRRSARPSVSTATRTRSSGSRHQGSSARPSASRPTSGFQPPFSPKSIRRRRPCVVRAVTRRSSTCAVRED